MKWKLGPLKKESVPKKKKNLIKSTTRQNNSQKISLRAEWDSDKPLLSRNQQNKKLREEQRLSKSSKLETKNSLPKSTLSIEYRQPKPHEYPRYSFWFVYRQNGKSKRVLAMAYSTKLAERQAKRLCEMWQVEYVKVVKKNKINWAGYKVASHWKE